MISIITSTLLTNSQTFQHTKIEAFQTRRSYDELSLEDLKAAQNGEQFASRKLLQRYAPMVSSFIGKFYKQPDLIEDLSQETFLRVFSALAKFQQNGSAKLSTWILVIASNLCKDHHKKLSRRERLELENGTPLWFEQQLKETDLKIEAQQQAKELQLAIYKLKPDLRIPFLLYAEQELSYQEIADALNIKVGTIRVKISRAKKQILKEVKYV